MTRKMTTIGREGQHVPLRRAEVGLGRTVWVDVYSFSMRVKCLKPPGHDMEVRSQRVVASQVREK